MKTHDFKVGDKVIINPDIPVGGEMPIDNYSYTIMMEPKRQPGVFTVERISAEGFIGLNNNFYYGPTGLLHIPMYEVGDVVMISDDCSCETSFGVIGSVESDCYTPTYLGEDGCGYGITLSSGKGAYIRSNQLKLIESPKPIKLNQQENENQLQRKEVAVSRGDEFTGSSICYRRCKASITVGHLSYKEISGS